MLDLYMACKSAQVRYLLANGHRSTSEIASLVQCSPQLVRWNRSRLHRPVSKSALLEAEVRALRIEVERMARRLEDFANAQIGAM